MARFNVEDYAKVPERLKVFHERYVNGTVVTESLFVDESFIRFKATVTTDRSEATSKVATGHSEMHRDHSKEKALEKAETVAVGRALANLGILADKSIASKEEMEAFEESKGTEKVVEKKVTRKPPPF